MSQFDSNKDYYGVLGVDKDATAGDIARQYKRQAAKHHPDRGGSEEHMKTLNEAYRVLRNSTSRSAYDDSRTPASDWRTTGGHWQRAASRRTAGRDFVRA